MLFIIIWLLLCLLALLILWRLTNEKITEDTNELYNMAFADATRIAQTYAQHLTREVEQVDQITQFIEYQWRQEGGKLKLEDLLKVSIFPPSLLNFVAIFDRDGLPVTSTISIRGLSSAADADYFKFHKTRDSPDFRIGTPTSGQNGGRPVIHFTRRLDSADGSFDGVVLVSVEVDALSALYGSASMGNYGLLAAAGTDGLLRIAKLGNGAVPALRRIPGFNSPEGMALLKGPEWFDDGRERFVAWKALTGYPLIPYAGLDKDEMLMQHQAAWRNYRQGAIAGSIFFLLFAFTGSVLSMQLAWRKHQTNEIRDSYRLATESGEEGFFRFGAVYDAHDRSRIVDFIVEDCNERGAAFYGMTRMELIGYRFSRLLSGEKKEATMDVYRSAMETGFHDGDFSVSPNSRLQGTWIHRRLVRSGSGLAVALRDISHSKAHERELSRMANEDALTNLPNRHWLMDSLPAALRRAAENNTMLALLFMDLNKFKNINDTFGHAVGDELLHAVALRLKSALRPTDNVVRMGGDEFVVVLEPVVSKDDAAEVAERIADAFLEPFKLSPGKRSVSASIGICLFPKDGDNVEALLKNADMAMYASKAGNHARYCFYETELSHKIKVKREIEQALVQAVEQDQFVLYYQPRVDAYTGQMRSMEALVRWMHPERGLVQPLDFIFLAEDTGIIIKLGELVMEKACAQIAQWMEQELHVVPVSINVSARQFNHGDLRQQFLSAVGRFHIDPALVELEITESSMMGEQASVDAQLTAFRDCGIKLLIDDFGTGYSSLSQLQRLDMDVLKVDQAFTAELGETKKSQVFYKAIVSMAHALGMSVVAEGVETQQQFKILQTLSCDEIQGFFISHPVPASEMSVLMRKSSLLPVSAG